MIVRHLLILCQRGLHWNAKKVTIEYRSDKVDFIVACTCYDIYHMFPVHNFCQALKKIFINPIRVFLCANSVVIVLQTFLIDTSTVEICRQLLGGAQCKQPRRRRWQEGHKLSYLKMKNSSFARFAHAFFILYISQWFLNVLSTTWNDMFCSYVDDVSTWRQLLGFSFLSAAPLGRSDQFNSRIVSKHFQAKRLGIIEEPDFKNTESIQMTLILAVVDVVLA